MASTTEDVVEDAAVESSREHWISHKVKDTYQKMCTGYHFVRDMDKGAAVKMGCKWVYRKAFSLDLPTERETKDGYDADRGGFGFMLGYAWSFISTFLFVYEMVSVGLVADSLLGSSRKKNVLGALTVVFMVLPTVAMAVIAVAFLEGRALAKWAQGCFSGACGVLMNDGSSCLSTVYGDTRSCVRSLGVSSRKTYFTVVKDLASAFRTVTSSPLNCFTGIILSPLFIVLWSLIFVFLALLFSLAIVCYTLLVVGGAAAFTLLVSAGLVIYVGIALGFLSLVIGFAAAFFVVVDIIFIFCWIVSPWLAAVLNVFGGRYRSFRGVVNAGFHSVPQTIVQVVLLTTSANSSVSKPKIIKTLAIVVLSGSWATLTLCVQARHFCRNLCGRSSTSLKFYVKEGLIVPVFEKESLGMDDLNGTNFRDTGTEIDTESGTDTGTETGTSETGTETERTNSDSAV